MEWRLKNLGSEINAYYLSISGSLRGVASRKRPNFPPQWVVLPCWSFVVWHHFGCNLWICSNFHQVFLSFGIRICFPALLVPLLCDIMSGATLAVTGIFAAALYISWVFKSCPPWSWSTWKLSIWRMFQTNPLCHCPLCSLNPPIESWRKDSPAYHGVERRIADSKSTGPVHVANCLACPQSLSSALQCTWVLCALRCIWSLSHLCTWCSGPQPAGNALACWCCESALDSNCPWIVLFKGIAHVSVRIYF